jgi:invasion protein IalB
MGAANMPNKAAIKQTLVAIALLLPPGGAVSDPPHARAGRFEGWRVDCTIAPLCVALTTLRGADGSEVLRLAFARGEAPSLAVTTRLPLHLPDGLVLAFGDSFERQAPWRTCGALGCEATFPSGPRLLEALRRERAGSATLTLVTGETVRLPFSLLGFSAAFRALDAEAVSP